MECPRKRYCAFCTINEETLLLLIAGLVLYVGIAHFYNWAVMDCTYIFIPHVVLTCLYILASFLLLCGVLCSVRGLMCAFICTMILCLVTNVVYAVMIYTDQRCLCDQLHIRSQNFTFHVAVMTVHGLLGFFAGVNFIICLASILLISKYLQYHPSEAGTDDGW